MAIGALRQMQSFGFEIQLAAENDSRFPDSLSS